MGVKLDQHFLNNEDILDKIISSSEIDSQDKIIEIGPGEGSLTRKILSKNPRKLISVEKDKSLKLDINDNKFQFIYGDGLVEIDNFEFSKLIANIPYSITEPLYTKIIDKKIAFVIMLHGIDFYKNIIERDTKWKYFVNAFYNVELITEVSGDEFEPKTKVKSAVVKLRIKNKFSKVEELYRNIWDKRSRNVLNCLIFSFVDTYKINKKEAKEKINSLKKNIVSSEKRLSKLFDKKFENLSNEEFMIIVNSLEI